jgi:hypothetical protein
MTCHPSTNLKFLFDHFCTFTLTLLLEHHLLFKNHIFTKLRPGNSRSYKDLNDDNVGLTESSSTSTELSTTGTVILILKFLLIFKNLVSVDHTWSKVHVTNS